MSNMSKIADYLSGYLGELDNYMERLNSNRLSRKDRQNFFEMSNEYYDIFKESIAGSDNNINVFPLLKDMEVFIDNIIGPTSDRNLANQYYDAITLRSNNYMEEVERTELQRQIFRNDVEIFRLQNEKIQMMQRLTDLEIQRDGQISPETMAILEVQHCEIVNGQVREILEWEQEKAAHEEPERQTKEEEQDEAEEKIMTPAERAIKDSAKEQLAEKEAAPVVLKFPYMKKETFMAVKEEIKKMGAKFNPDKKEWYVEQSAGQDMINKINEYLASHDDAIYLKLPQVGVQEFKQLIGQIKQDGARYNPDKKQWYITESADRNKFEMYLPTSAMRFKSGKDSVHGKLDQYKADAAKKQTDNRIAEHQKKEAPERV